MFALYPYKLLSILLILYALTGNTSLAISTTNNTKATYAYLAAPQATVKPGLAGTLYITWSNVSAAQYTIEYTTFAGGAFTPLATVNGSITNYRHSNLGYGETLHYRIKATSASGEVVYSNVVSATTHPANYSYRIMPLGDSNTDGGSGQIARADRVGYRTTLYHLLRSAGFTVDLVGSEVSGTNTVAAFQQQYGYAPDLNHAGFGGAKNYDIVSILQNSPDNSGPYLDKYNPDIVLLHIGTNSLGYSQNITELESILNQVDAYEARSAREVTVVLAQIIKQCYDCGANEEDKKWDELNTADYNQRLRTLATRRQAAGDRIVLVDMSEGAGINYSMHADMEDYLHPNLNGFAKMAQVWFNAVKPLLTPTDTHDPDTRITSNPEKLTNSRTASFAFTSNEAGVTYQVNLDAAGFTTATSPYTLKNLTDGNHTLQVRAKDASGNTDSSPATYTWTIDATPPAPPTIVAISDDLGPVNDDGITTDNTLLLKGEAEAGATVTISRNGVGVIGNTKASSSGKWEFSYEQTVLPAAQHTFTATAADALGNTSPAGKAFVVTIDRSAPTVVLATTAASPVNKAFQVQVTFNEAVYNLQLADFIVSNGTLSNLQAQSTAAYTLLLTPTTDGSITLQLPAGKATDLAGNSNTVSNTLQLTADITRPTVTIASAAAQVLNTDFDITITFSEAVTGFDLADVAVTNGTLAGLTKASDKQYTANVKATAQGPVTIQVPANVATDAAINGNEPSNTLTRTYDSVAPTGYTVAFNVAQVNVNNQANITLTIANAESGANYSYSINSENGGAAVTGTGKAEGTSVTISGLVLSGLNDGMLTVQVFLTDQAGNKGQAATAQVEKITKEIAAVNPSGEVRVPFGTEFKEINLPLKVQVNYTTGEQQYLDVTWQPGNYNRLVAGTYTITGDLALAPKTTNFGNRKGSIRIVVEPNLPPTELVLSATHFKPNAEPTDVLGSFTTQDPEDERFTYELVAGEGDTHNSYFMVQNAELYLVSNKGLSGIKSFSIRVRTTDPYQNSLERTFTLTKLPYEQRKIELVNAFSPDGDGINDTWTLHELRFYNQVEVTIMDRSGVRLFHSTDPEKGWDGKAKNGEVKEGPYFYIIHIKDIDLVQKGVVTVLK